MLPLRPLDKMEDAEEERADVREVVEILRSPCTGQLSPGLVRLVLFVSALARFRGNIFMRKEDKLRRGQ